MREMLFLMAQTFPKEKVIIEGNDHGQDPRRDKMHKALTKWLGNNLDGRAGALD